MEVILKPQIEFPLLEKYKEVFPITKDTIFAYDNVIYSNNNLPEHLIIHEKVHIRQQNEKGLDEWVFFFLKNPAFRLEQELEAYREQLDSIKDRNLKALVRMESAKNLSGGLYGDIITFQKALELLK